MSAPGGSVSAIVLAAGESKRMGTQKALLDWGGVPLIAYHLQQLARVEAVREVIVVTGHDPQRVREIASSYAGAVVVHNTDYRSGKVSSLLAGLRALGSETNAIMILAVDQPRDAAMLSRLAEAHAASGAAITVPVHGGRRGHPTLFDSSLLPGLMAISEATEGLRAVLRAHAVAIHEAECDASVLVDLNDPDDLAATNARRAPA